MTYPALIGISVIVSPLAEMTGCESGSTSSSDAIRGKLGTIEWKRSVS